MSNRDGVIFDKKNSKNNFIVFKDGKFAGRKCLFSVFKLHKNQVWEIAIVIDCPLSADLVDKYKEMKKEINEKYFISESDYESYKYPYEKGDGHTETAISIGKASFSCYWVFKKQSITLEITKNMNIMITYQDTKLTEEAVNAIEEKNKSDY